MNTANAYETRGGARPHEGTARTVLVVDDDPTMSRTVKRLLTAAGYEVLTAQSGSAAVEIIAKRPVDVILSDIQMPGMSGLELLSKVRTYDLDVPVVLMTGVPRLETAIEAVSFGALQYLVKPVPNDVMLKAMDRATQLHRLARLRRDALRHLGDGEVHAVDRAGLQALLDRALESLWIAYQPILDVTTRRIFGYEALLRSEEPGLPTPGAVLSAAERLNRLWDVGRAVRRLAARSFQAAPADALLFVNLHTRDLLDDALYDFDAPLSKMAGRVVLEITERASLDGVTDVPSRLRTLRSLGFRVAIDDLGAGYAGLTSFAALEPEIVKLDMSLVRGVEQSAVRQRLIASMTSLCREMGKKIIAEGVETRQECETLRLLGCDLLQGFLFSRPGPFFADVNVAY